MIRSSIIFDELILHLHPLKVFENQRCSFVGQDVVIA